MGRLTGFAPKSKVYTNKYHFFVNVLCVTASLMFDILFVLLLSGMFYRLLMTGDQIFLKSSLLGSLYEATLWM